MAALIIQTAGLSPEGLRVSGEEPPGFLQLEEDKFARDAGPLRYDLRVSLVSGEIVVQGQVKIEVSVLCARCGGFFSTTLEDSSFLRAYDLAENQESVNLAPDIREELLLRIPTFPSCGWTGTGTCPHSGVKLENLRQEDQPAVDHRWDALDDLSSS